ncbi:BTAD domain-containing putative transcriptional regulator [Actinoplanes sichuanensis]|uniref:BTAD domain-containing putative transcriptional regulator n=1 Tax=Actinoplanes sichuanensis TaxID=512349 RepID=A0ABW4AQW6_9ACTN|nr:BTAD domain-containing putative transcriptional regulator [Actinoplanes sichuanensis]BEL02060.1 BTAD domain-containing putative transcriptional regulator [Actinoplanes sichuanensis]
MIEVRVLGPFQVLVDGEPVALGGPRPRAVLAMLVAAHGRTVPVDRIVDELWGENPPPSAVATLQAYISRLRKLLEPRRAPRAATTVLVGDPVGYALTLPAEAVDAWRMEREVHSVQRARDLTAEQALAVLRTGLDRWRGEPFPEFAAAPWAQAEITRLREARLVGRERSIACLLKMGRTDEAITAAAELAGEYPLRGLSWWLYALGLWAGGRDAEALAVLERHRELLAEELGLDPEPALTDLEQAIRDGRTDTRERLLDFGAEPDEFAVRPAQLPRTPATFAAREAELVGLAGAGAARTVITGPGGVGKTTLAIRWAHLVAERYPDGQLYADLRGFGPEETPADPGDVLAGFLVALGVTDQRIPPGTAERSALFRGLLDGRRMLLVLDNAHDAAQVRPLLPGDPGCAVVVTSRDRLTELGARTCELDVFDAVEAAAYLRERLGATLVDEAPEARDAVIAGCGGLPLALAVVCARAAGFPLSVVAEELAEEGLDAFAGPGYDLRAVFSWSYRRLPADAATLFRQLALHPGPDLSFGAVVSAGGRERAATRALLDRLVGAHLLVERRPGRYSYHDLIRSYAVGLAEVDRADVLRRLVEYHLHSANAAVHRYAPFKRADRVGPVPADVTPERFTSDRRALSWLHAEYDNVMALAGLCDEPWGRRYLAPLAWALAPYQQDTRFALDDSFGLCERALAVTGELWWSGFLNYMIGRGHLRLDQRAQARPYLVRTIEVGRATDDPQRLGNGLLGMAVVIMGLNNTPTREQTITAYPYAREALEVYRRYEYGEPDCARALNPLAWYHFHRPGGMPEALRLLGEALAINRKWGHTHGAAGTLAIIGRVRHAGGDPAGAVAPFREAVTLLSDMPELQIEAMIGLYAALRDSGDVAEAERVGAEARVLTGKARYYDAERVRTVLAG